jgi:hypothetical protein
MDAVPFNEERSRNAHRLYDVAEPLPPVTVVRVTWKREEPRLGPITLLLDAPHEGSRFWSCGWGTKAQAMKLAKRLGAVWGVA